MKPNVQFLFDFGSPNAYLCHQVIPAIEARSGIRFDYVPVLLGGLFKLANNRDRKSTRLNSSHLVISYAVFCLKKKKKKRTSSPAYSHTSSICVQHSSRMLTLFART